MVHSYASPARQHTAARRRWTAPIAAALYTPGLRREAASILRAASDLLPARPPHACDLCSRLGFGTGLLVGQRPVKRQGCAAPNGRPSDRRSRVWAKQGRLGVAAPGLGRLTTLRHGLASGPRRNRHPLLEKRCAGWVGGRACKGRGSRRRRAVMGRTRHRLQGRQGRSKGARTRRARMGEKDTRVWQASILRMEDTAAPLAKRALAHRACLGCLVCLGLLRRASALVTGTHPAGVVVRSGPPGRSRSATGRPAPPAGSKKKARRYLRRSSAMACVRKVWPTLGHASVRCK